MEIMRHVGLWFWIVLQHWKAGIVGGGVMGVITALGVVLEHLWQGFPKKYFLYIFVFGFLLCSSFLAWEDQYNDATMLTKLNANINSSNAWLQADDERLQKELAQAKTETHIVQLPPPEQPLRTSLDNLQKAALRERAFRLSGDIWKFLLDRQEYAPPKDPSKLDDQTSMQYDIQTARLCRQRYDAQIFRVFDDLEPYGQTNQIRGNLLRASLQPSILESMAEEITDLAERVR